MLGENEEEKLLRAGIIGASGYTGAELMRILAGHPEFEVEVATAGQYAGTSIDSLYPSLAGAYARDFVSYEPGVLDSCDIVFSCLPHGESMSVVAQAAAAGRKVVDLSADFRLPAEVYTRWYGIEHQSPELLTRAVYGLCELNRGEISRAALIANPGCYSTASLLGLSPLAKAGMIAGTVIIDAKTGISGAGRKLTLPTHFPQASDNITPYAVGGHRHAPEISLCLDDLAQVPVKMVFTPHLAPMDRGILSTMYVPLPPGAKPAEVRAVFEEAYSGEAFVHLLEEGAYPQTKAVRGSNNCHLALEVSPAGVAIVMSAIDNLVKGASGQAVQSANIMFGIDEGSGLQGCGLFP